MSGAARVPGRRPGAGRLLLRGVRAFGRAWVALLGGDRYDRYVAWHRARHPGVPPLDVGAYWRSVHAQAEHDPGSRCC